MSRSNSPKRRRNSKPQNHPVLVCPESGRKIKYGSRKVALSALNNLRAKPRLATSPVRVYHCPFCAGWHMTSSEQRRAA